MRFVALIPARAGSKRVPGKNTRLLAGHPLIAYTIAAARQSGVFANVICCTDDERVKDIAIQYGAEFMSRPTSEDHEPDIDWVRHAFRLLNGLDYNAFAILRPTSPFRTAETIKRAHRQFIHSEAHSLRAMQPAKEHPGKMWTVSGPGYPAVPLLSRIWPEGLAPNPAPWHSMPTQTLPQVYIQNASLEMAWSYVVPSFGTISGKKVTPFFTAGYEGFDINTEDDFEKAEMIAEDGFAILPEIHARTI